MRPPERLEKGGAEGMYKTQISDARWIAYDIPGNVGWIAFLAGLILCLTRRPAALENGFIFALVLLDLPCAGLMVVGIGELISQRLQKLDRVLPKKRLYRGFGALTLGGLAGGVFSLLALAAAWGAGLPGRGYLAAMCVGGLLCFVFGGLLFRGYRKI